MNYDRMWTNLNRELGRLETVPGELSSALEGLELQQRNAGFIKDDLKEVRRMSFESADSADLSFRAQLNPRRADRHGGAGISSPPVGQQNINNGCFLCRENIRWQQDQCQIGFEILTENDSYNVLMNPFPLLPNHVVVASHKHVPQAFRLPDEQGDRVTIDHIVKDLCEIAKPNYGIITNIGKAHLEGFKNIEGVKKTKKELYDYIKINNGKIFINNEDTILKEISKDIKIISYGLNGEINGRIKESSIFTNVEFNSQIIETQLIGTYQFYNIMLSIAVATHFGIKLKNISKALSSYKPSNNRSQVIKTKFNTIILDAYNANPSSMYEMINSFSKIQKKNKICILGDMAELGEYSKKEHLNLIHLLENLKINCLFVGNEFSKLNSTGSFFDVENLINYLKKKQIKDSTILVKGSRSIKLEKVIKVL